MIALQTIQEELLVEFNDILKMIAVKYNTTVEAVYSEMQNVFCFSSEGCG